MVCDLARDQPNTNHYLCGFGSRKLTLEQPIPWYYRHHRLIDFSPTFCSHRFAHNQRKECVTRKMEGRSHASSKPLLRGKDRYAVIARTPISAYAIPHADASVGQTAVFCVETQLASLR